MTRRDVVTRLAGALALAATIDPERALWTPGKKLISIPSASVKPVTHIFGIRVTRKSTESLGRDTPALARAYLKSYLDTQLRLSCRTRARFHDLDLPTRTAERLQLGDLPSVRHCTFYDISADAIVDSYDVKISL